MRSETTFKEVSCWRGDAWAIQAWRITERMARDRTVRDDRETRSWEEQPQEASGTPAPIIIKTRNILGKFWVRASSPCWCHSSPLLISSVPKAEFSTRVIMVRERMEAKEQETSGFWLTQEKMKKSGEYSAHLGCIQSEDQCCQNSLAYISIILFHHLSTGVINCWCFTIFKYWIYFVGPVRAQLRDAIKAIVTYCKRFPQVLVRQIWHVIPVSFRKLFGECYKIYFFQSRVVHININMYPHFELSINLPVDGSMTRILKSTSSRRPPNRQWSSPSFAVDWRPRTWENLASSIVSNWWVVLSCPCFRSRLHPSPLQRLLPLPWWMKVDWPRNLRKWVIRQGCIYTFECISY